MMSFDFISSCLPLLYKNKLELKCQSQRRASQKVNIIRMFLVLCPPDSFESTVAFSYATHSMATSRLVLIIVCRVRQFSTGKQMNLSEIVFFADHGQGVG